MLAGVDEVHGEQSGDVGGLRDRPPLEDLPRSGVQFPPGIRPPAWSSARSSSDACAVARATRLVMPRPKPGSRSCSQGPSRRGVNPDSSSAGQNLFPGLAKCQPVAAEYWPGLMP